MNDILKELEGVLDHMRTLLCNHTMHAFGKQTFQYQHKLAITGTELLRKGSKFLEFQTAVHHRELRLLSSRFFIIENLES